jgi:hypothetical protein
MAEIEFTEVAIRERVLDRYLFGSAEHFPDGGQAVPDEVLEAVAEATGLRIATEAEIREPPKGMAILGFHSLSQWRGDTLRVYGNWGGDGMQLWGRECDLNIYCPDGDCVLSGEFGCGGWIH